jgi:hypothetical protein
VDDGRVRPFRELRTDYVNMDEELWMKIKWECELVISRYDRNKLMAVLASVAMDVANALNTHPTIRRKYNKPWNVCCSANMGLYVKSSASVMFSNALTGLCVCVWTDGHD